MVNWGGGSAWAGMGDSAAASITRAPASIDVDGGRGT